MKYEKFSAMFTHPELHTTLWGASSRAPKEDVGQPILIENFFQSPRRLELLPVLVDAIKRALPSEKDTCKQLMEKLARRLGECGDSVIQEKARKVFEEIVKGTKLEKVLAKAAKPAKAERSPAACGAIDLRMLSDLSVHLAQVNGFQKRTKEFSEHDKDPGEKRPTDVPGFDMNATNVRMGPGRSLLLTGIPKNRGQVNGLFGTILAQGIPVLASLLERHERTEHCNGFWEPASIAQVVLRDGWALRHAGARIIATDEPEKGFTKRPNLIETRLIATRGAEERNLTHFYIDAWRDHCAGPSLNLLYMLVNRIQQCQNRVEPWQNRKEECQAGIKRPVHINCAGGYGRTGTLALLLIMIQDVYEKLGKGLPLSAIEVDIPARAVDLRRERFHVLNGDEQMSQVYDGMRRLHIDLAKQQGLVREATGLPANALSIISAFAPVGLSHEPAAHEPAVR